MCNGSVSPLFRSDDCSGLNLGCFKALLGVAMAAKHTSGEGPNKIKQESVVKFKC